MFLWVNINLAWWWSTCKFSVHMLLKHNHFHLSEAHYKNKPKTPRPPLYIAEYNSAYSSIAPLSGLFHKLHWEQIIYACMYMHVYVCICMYLCMYQHVSVISMYLSRYASWCVCICTGPWSVWVPAATLPGPSHWHRPACSSHGSESLIKDCRKAAACPLPDSARVPRQGRTWPGPVALGLPPWPPGPAGFKTSSYGTLNRAVRWLWHARSYWVDAALPGARPGCIDRDRRRQPGRRRTVTWPPGPVTLAVPLWLLSPADDWANCGNQANRGTVSYKADSNTVTLAAGSLTWTDSD